MSELSPIPKDQRRIDTNHLDILSIFHFVGASLALFGILFLLGHYAFMHAMFNNPQFWRDQKQEPPPPQIFAMFRWVYLGLGAWLLASGVLNLISGLCLHARKHRTFSLIVGGINCLHVPLGTVLGVFTIVILVRDSVRELYEA